MLCSFCGKDVKAAGHIMVQCMALHNNRLTINESQKRPSFVTMLVNLRRVPMGQFLRHAVKEMEQLPFVLTKDGKAVAIIGPFKGDGT